MSTSTTNAIPQFFNELQERIVSALRQSPASELERNVKALLAQGFQKMDLVTREELDIQAALLAKAMQRVGELEQRLVVLEQAAASKKP